jgi:transcriptional antiterminator
MEDSIINSTLLLLYNQGKSEIEAFDELSTTLVNYSINLKLISKYYEIFKSCKDKNLDSIAKRKMPKFTNEQLISLINENPHLNIRELAALLNVSKNTVSRRIKKINNADQKVNYIPKTPKHRANKLTEENLSNLINQNPELNAAELSKLASTSATTVLNRLKQINNARSPDDKLTLTSKKPKTKGVTDDELTKLINENQDLNMGELAKLVGVSVTTIRRRIKKISNSKLDLIEYSNKGSQNGITKFTDSYLISLVDQNPDANLTQLARLAASSTTTIFNRIRQINSTRKEEDKIVLLKNRSKPIAKLNTFSDKYLIDLVNSNPDLNIKELADLANTSTYYITTRIKKINKADVNCINYTKKGSKFSNEYLIKLISENPDLNLKQLSKLAGTSSSTIFNRIKEISKDSQKLIYRSKAIRKAKEFTDEELIKS